MKRMIGLAVAIATFIFLISCETTPSLYKWYNYDNSLYQYYKDPSTAEAFRVNMEKAVHEIETAKGRVPPGLYAEIGTLYLQKGDRQGAAGWYKKERSAWPESTAFMTALIDNLEKKD